MTFLLLHPVIDNKKHSDTKNGNLKNNYNHNVYLFLQKHQQVPAADKPYFGQTAQSWPALCYMNLSQESSTDSSLLYQSTNQRGRIE